MGLSQVLGFGMQGEEAQLYHMRMGLTVVNLRPGLLCLFCCV